jgi:hypothetical protein
MRYFCESWVRWRHKGFSGQTTKAADKWCSPQKKKAVNDKTTQCFGSQKQKIGAYDEYLLLLIRRNRMLLHLAPPGRLWSDATKKKTTNVPG